MAWQNLIGRIRERGLPGISACARIVPTAIYDARCLKRTHQTLQNSSLVNADARERSQKDHIKKMENKDRPVLAAREKGCYYLHSTDNSTHHR